MFIKLKLKLFFPQNFGKLLFERLQNVIKDGSHDILKSGGEFKI